MKTLTPAEMQDLIDSRFNDWHTWTLTEFNALPSFKGLLTRIEKAGELSLKEKIEAD
jgi:hypothetical protein